MPPCLVQNEQVQTRTGISGGSGSQVREKEIFPQWHLPWINIGAISVVVSSLAQPTHRQGGRPLKPALVAVAGGAAERGALARVGALIAATGKKAPPDPVGLASWRASVVGARTRIRRYRYHALPSRG